MAIFGHSSGELVAGLDLLDAEVLTIGLSHDKIVRDAILKQARIAPDIDSAIFIQRNNMVVAGCNVDDLRIANLFRNILQVNGIGVLGVAPGIDLTVGVDADAIGRAGRDVSNLSLHCIRDGHHVLSWRNIQLGIVMIGQIQLIEIRSHHNENKNDEKHDQADHAELVMQEILCNQAAGALELLFLHEVVLFIAVAEKSGKEAGFFLLIHFLTSFTYQRGHADQQGRSSGR